MSRLLIAVLLAASSACWAVEPSPSPTIARLKSLPADTRKLSVSWPNAESMALLARFKQLEVVEFYDMDLDDAGWKSLAALKSLKSLTFDSRSNITGEELHWLAGLTALEELYIDHWTACNDEQVGFVEKLPNLRRLRLTMCEFTPKGLARIAALPNLEALALPRCDVLNDDDLAVLTTAPKLRELDLAECEGLTDGALEQISGLERLEVLNLDAWVWVPACFTSVHWNAWTGAGLKHLTKLKRLKVLNLQGTPALTDDDCKTLARIETLESLIISYCDFITDAGIRHLAALPQLRELRAHNVDYEGMRGHGFDAFGPESKLEVLNLRDYSGVDDVGFEAICRLPRLRVLHVEGCGELSVDGFRHLASAVNVREIYLGCQRITPEAFLAICGATGLEVISAWGASELTNESFARLAALKQIRVLDLMDASRIGDGAFEHLADLTSLRELRITESRVSNSGLLCLEKLTELEVLDLHGATKLSKSASGLRTFKALRVLGVSTLGGLTDAALKDVSGLQSLEELWVSLAPDTTNAAVEGLSQLAKLTSLRISDTKAKHERAVDRLRESLPKADVDYWPGN